MWASSMLLMSWTNSDFQRREPCSLCKSAESPVQAGFCLETIPLSFIT